MGATVLNFETHRLHAFERHGSKLPWFVLAEVCKVLALDNPSYVAERLDEDEKGLVNDYTLGGSQQVLCVSLSGLTRLASTSRKPVAKRFNKWLHSDVVVSIFLTGEFTGDSTPLDDLVGSFQPLLDLPEPKTAKYRDNVVPLQSISEPQHDPEECERKHEQKQITALRRIGVEGIQGRLDLGPSPTEKTLDELNEEANRQFFDALCGHSSHQYGGHVEEDVSCESWNEQHEGIVYTLIMIPSDGRWRPLHLSMMRADDPSGLVLPADLRILAEDGAAILLSVDRGVPLDVIHRGCERLPSPLSSVSLATINHFFGG